MASAPSGQGVALQRMLCEVCGAPLDGRQERFCSDAHRWQMWDREHPRQGMLPIEPAPQPLIALNPTAPKNRKHSLQQACLLILGRLQQGPAGALEVRALGGWRTSARINELRAAGHYIVGPQPAPRCRITETTNPGPDGLDTYELWGR